MHLNNKKLDQSTSGLEPLRQQQNTKPQSAPLEQLTLAPNTDTQPNETWRRVLLLALPVLVVALTAVLILLIYKMPRQTEVKMAKIVETPAPTEQLVHRTTVTEAPPVKEIEIPSQSVSFLRLHSRKLSNTAVAGLVQKSTGVTLGLLEQAPELNLDGSVQPGTAGPADLEEQPAAYLALLASNTAPANPSPSSQANAVPTSTDLTVPTAASPVLETLALPDATLASAQPSELPPVPNETAAIAALPATTTSPVRESNKGYKTSGLDVYVYGDTVNVRQDASTDSSILHKVHEGDVLHEIETNGTWSRVRLPDGFEGYIFSNLLSYNYVAPPKEQAAPAALASTTFQPYYGTLYASNSGVNVRAEASTSSEIYESIYYGDSVTAIGYAAGWFQIQWYDGKVAYVHGDYLQTDPISQAELTGEIIHEDVAYIAAELPANPADYAGGSAVVGLALQYVGCPYVYGAAGPDAFDCSGFAQYIYKQMGVYLGRTTYDQVYDGIAVNFAYRNYSNLVPGDLLLFAEGSDIYHVGIYIGGGQMVHAGTSATGVIIDDLNLEYYASRLAHVRRIFY